MKQWIIDRYNKEQDKYGANELLIDQIDIYYKNTMPEIPIATISLYDFLFNPKWGFAKAFWGEWECQIQKPLGIIPVPFTSATQQGSGLTIDKYHLQRMAISDDPIKYLDQFKD